ncbi:sensor histidine kinase [Streptomyces pacificus]|uniref:histidine kinase n=1 Tax=Streptomyces pacificus TaxID=2705029 RepID=A0A6A0B1R1_9ACTN|nr:ATP-binding protein [Streptomyces pacificus]GFH38558.1 histidine kinase [Streptomyces pacificus]
MRRRLRPPTIRGRIVALTLVPAVALLALWSFAVVSATGDLRALIRLQSVYEAFGTPVDTAVGQIQIERRLAAAYLGTPRRNAGAADAAALLAQQRSTDRAVQAMRDALGDRDRREDLTGRQRESLDAMVRAASGLEDLRDRVVERRMSWGEAVQAYTVIVEPTFDVQSQLTALQAGQLAREAQVVVELVRVREFVSREDALVAGARAAGVVTDAQYDALTAAIEDRRVFHRTYVPALPPDSRKLFTDFERGPEYRALIAGEDALLRAGAAKAGRAVADASWRTTTDRAVRRYMLLCTESALNAAGRGRAFAYREMTEAAVVGVAGLAAAGLSVWLSASAGRRIAGRLEELRDAADVLATRRLPEVMERLGAGEDVDPAAAAPPLDFADGGGEPDEITQVGTALNAARRAAVEAAVKQATLRRGVFAVLLNIARRNQVLIHRQAKLVDTLERRTTDPDTLGELFRIDHLTTRMRRHAEGLIILSGAAPGRRWREPVPLVDVVAAATGEIEDYTRVVVPPMPAVRVGADAVADMVHLLAELVENATVFSPPHTRVTMRTGEARNGFVLEIDDRGLGLDGDELARAHRTLSRPGAFDPVQDERLGLYIVGRLAARHGITVTLTRSPYGGTTAVVLLPNAIISPADPDSRRPPAASRAASEADSEADSETDAPANPDSVPAAQPVPVPVPEPQPDVRPPPEPLVIPVPGGGRDEDHEEAAAGESVLPPAERRSTVRDNAPGAGAPAGPAPRSGPLPGEGPEQPVTGAGPAPRPGAARPLRGIAAPGPLPRRIRQASLAAPLGEPPPGPGRDGSGPGEREVGAEEMRAVFGAFQRGLERGRGGEPAGYGSGGASGGGGRREDGRSGSRRAGARPPGSVPGDGSRNQDDEGTRDDG